MSKFAVIGIGAFFDVLNVLAHFFIVVVALSDTVLSVVIVRTVLVVVGVFISAWGQFE